MFSSLKTINNLLLFAKEKLKFLPNHSLETLLCIDKPFAVKIPLIIKPSKSLSGLLLNNSDKTLLNLCQSYI